jgi:hypothetical protein
MTEKDIEKLVHMNQRLTLVLGYTMGLIHQYEIAFNENEKEKYRWICQAVENIVYLDKPFPPIP